MLSNSLAQLNAPSLISSIVGGIVVVLLPIKRRFVEVSIIALQFSRESYIGFSLSTLRQSIEQFSNAR